MTPDLTELENLCKGDNARKEKYIKFYLNTSGELFGDLLRLANENDYETLADTAHGMRPQVLIMGSSELYDLLKQIELSAKSQNPSGVLALVNHAIEINMELMNALKSILP